jgi:hypothetical protein
MRPLALWLTMNLPWRRKLPTGEALVEEAERRGVSLHETWKGGAEGKTIVDEAELQRRVLAARSARQSMIVNLAQTIGIVAALGLSVWNLQVERAEKSGELMLTFNTVLYSGGSERIARTLDENGNLDKANVEDAQLEDFLDKYELLDLLYKYHLINKDMAYNAFEYELETGLGDPKVRLYLLKSRSESTDLHWRTRIGAVVRDRHEGIR